MVSQLVSVLETLGKHPSEMLAAFAFFLIAACTVYAIRNGRDVDTTLRWGGKYFSFRTLDATGMSVDGKGKKPSCQSKGRVER